MLMDMNYLNFSKNWKNGGVLKPVVYAYIKRNKYIHK